ncbi:MAG: hypothetical protein JST92_27315 [Deltaproteobacteria bacterium]|nr:hypothetical protein [Deltaproteobacteria bacterium]
MDRTPLIRPIAPEKDFGKGPDVLWLRGDAPAFVVEAKSRKKSENALTKKDLGQLLTSVEWFKDAHPGHASIPVSVHPNALASKSIVAKSARALTYTGLAKIIAALKALLTDAATVVGTEEAVASRLAALLPRSAVNPTALAQLLEPFEEAEQ